jgi:hypothetical protein
VKPPKKEHGNPAPQDFAHEPIPGIAAQQPVTVCKVNPLTIDFHDRFGRIDMHAHGAIQEIVGPIIMITKYAVDIHAAVPKLIQMTDHIEVAFRDNVVILEPEVEEVSDEKQGAAGAPDHIEELVEVLTSFLFLITVVESKMYVGDKVRRGGHRW